MTTWNVHPLFVHFPIAFLCLYSVLELLRFHGLQRQSWWFPLKAVLLIVGSISAFVALQTGELAEEAFESTDLMNVVELHSLFATTSTWIYVALTALYAVRWLDLSGSGTRLPQKFLRFWNALVRLEQQLFRAPILIVLAILGITGMTFTGALGAVLVYGPEIDPAVSVLYRLFFH